MKDKVPDWKVIGGCSALHIGALCGGIWFSYLFSWSGLVIACITYFISGILGIDVCLHRLLTHRSFKTYKWFEYLLTSFALLAWQGTQIQWVGTHRLHHRHSDTDADPHTPRHGFTWSHIFWCMHKDGKRTLGAQRAAKDLVRDKVHHFLSRYYLIPQLVLAGILYGTAYLVSGHQLALSWVVWGICIRMVVLYHATWFVNSAAHTWGYQNFKTNDGSRNLWWVAILSWGEGWHNNHHGIESSARHGMRTWELDPVFWIILFLRRIGLAWDVRVPKEPRSWESSHPGVKTLP